MKILADKRLVKANDSNVEDVFKEIESTLRRISAEPIHGIDRRHIDDVKAPSCVYGITLDGTGAYYYRESLEVVIYPDRKGYEFLILDVSMPFLAYSPSKENFAGSYAIKDFTKVNKKLVKALVPVLNEFGYTEDLARNI